MFAIRRPVRAGHVVLEIRHDAFARSIHVHDEDVDRQLIDGGLGACHIERWEQNAILQPDGEAESSESR